MTFAIWGGRIDAGGLAAQTQALARHLNPDHAVVFDLGKQGRGTADHDTWGDATIVAWPCDDLDNVLQRALDAVDTLLAVETFYMDDLPDRARDAKARTICQVNPELWKPQYALPDAMWTATTWETGRLPMTARLMPFPIDRQRFAFRQRTEARTFFHMAAPAFHDRNGTDLVFAACRHVRTPITLLVRGKERTTPRQIGRVTIRNLGPPTRGHRDAWPDEADVLLLPRRYGGLSLTAQEGASLGMPVVMLDVEPQHGWFPPELLVPAHVKRQVQMIGGVFPVHDADPRVLAAKIDWLAQEPENVVWLSKAMDEWAGLLDWQVWTPRYRELLGA